MAIVEIRDVVKQFGEGEAMVKALKGVSFEVQKGEFVCIMGASGSGKTTLLQMLGGLDRPTHGDVVVDGTHVSDLKEQDLALYRRNKIGFVFQQFQLIPVLSAEENVALPMLIDHREQSRSIQRARDLLRVVGLENRRHHRPAQLSGGQQQRVAIARALSTEPAILLADEPTGALDSATSQEIMKLLRETCDTVEQTCIVVSHDPFVAAHADRVIVMKDGEIKKQLHLEGHWATRKLAEQIQYVQTNVNLQLNA